ncbi:winged helix-turn-helix domain-containing protein [Acidiferrimicrobium sp. IK]|uniref:ArsR/SmtB family transcription factor n=1 Tax=Acidiferrimicrobium sp. IK TaxID=2871700 RepID=UPI0021CB8F1C|nr:winged helix-turn-helix domain-containing protein [Acidiferrimicrobium sp. IK]MCU4186595.1 winged helix-turn-helix domain-containing protein [Acidiferrimicrobium sp. IK]
MPTRKAPPVRKARDVAAGGPVTKAGAGRVAKAAAAASDTRARQKATLAEARAVAHPVRLRIIRLCLDEALTNKELAQRLGMNAGTTLHHVRTLVANGFLAEQEGRPAARGTTGKPYRSTGKSWLLDIDDSEQRDQVERAMLQAVAAEVDEAGPGAVIEASRLAMRLRPEQIEELTARLQAVIDDYGASAADDPDGEPVAMLLLLHRRRRR